MTGSFNADNVLGYNGKAFDETTKLYNYGFRDYAPSLGRFTTVDPVRDGNSWYSYVGMNPVNFMDTWGLLKQSPTEDKDVNLRPLVQIPILGIRAAYIVGFSGSTTLIVNPNSILDSGVAYSGGVGTGIEVAIDTPLNPFIEGVVETIIGAIDLSSEKPASTQDIEGTQLNAYVGTVVGTSFSLVDKEFTGLEVLSIGGGVYIEHTEVITVQDVIDKVKMVVESVEGLLE